MSASPGASLGGQQRPRASSARHSAVPAIAREVLNESGSPLEPADRAHLEPRFGRDFTGVRVHTGSRADEAADSLGALAYSWNNDIVLSRHAATAKLPVLAHELAHVTQQGTERSGRSPATVVGPGDPGEHAAGAAANLVANGRDAHVAAALSAGICLLRDSRLDRLLDSLASVARNAPSPLSDEGLVDLVLRHFHGVNLRDPDNLEPVSDAVARHFPEPTFFAFLQRVDTDPAAGETSAEERHHQATLRHLQVPRRGVYGTRTPLPVTEMVSGTAARVIGHATAVGESFLGGVVDGLGGPDSDALVRRLSDQLTASAVLNTVAPQVFAAGAVVGIGQDFWHTIRGLWNLITDFPAMLEQFRTLFNTLVSPAAPGFARLMGRHLGQEWRADLTRMAQYNVFRFTFELGRIVGPTIVYAVLTLLGVTAAAAVSAAAVRMAQLLRRFPHLLRSLERIARHLPRRRPSAFAGLTDAEIEAAVAGIDVPRTTGGRSRPRIGDRAVPRTQRRRLDVDTLPRRAGETARAAVARVRQVIGRRISDIPELRAAWDRARAEILRTNTLTAGNYPELYNLTRRRFWQEVRSDPVARRRFADAGFDLPDDATQAPMLRGVDSAIPLTETRVSLDHIAEKAIGDNWRVSLDADNLRMEFQMPNTYREIVQSRHPDLR